MSFRRVGTRNPRLIAAILAASIFVFLPGVTWALSTRTLFHGVGDMTNPNYGYSVGNAGDVNGDGYADFIVGAPGYVYSTGRANVYFGGPELDDIPDLSLFGEVAGDLFGWSVGTAGDINGDGYADVIVGAFVASSSRGRAYVYFGGPTPDAVADLTMTGGVGGDQLGYSVGTLNDVNEDGFDDVIVGMPGYNGQQGRALIYFGGSTPDASPDVTMTGDALGDFYGEWAGRAGDVNGDGHEDVIVSTSVSGGYRGSVYVYYGGPYLDNWPDWVLLGEAQDQWFGRPAKAAGDVNGDGFGDIVVGEIQNPPGQSGRAYLFLGGYRPDNVPDVIVEGVATYDQVGQWVSTAGDVNADGYTDWMVGKYGESDQLGHVTVYYGGPTPDGTPDLDFAGEVVNGLFGTAAHAGDFDGDGFVDILVGSHGWEPGHVFLKGIYPYQVLAPNGGEQWVAGRRSVVRWRGHDPADLAISYDGGSSWSTIASGIGGLEENEYEVVAPSIATEHAMVRLSYTGQAVKRGNSDASDHAFRIVTPTRTPAVAQRLQLAPTGTASNQFLGASVSAAGDMNGDGYGDVIVGAYGYNNNQGRAYVYYGGPAADLIPDLTLTGEGPFQSFGISAHGAGDVNGDGYADVIVGAQEYAGSTGRAYVYYGGPAPDAVADLTLTGLASGYSFGGSVDGAGDVNGDGFADLIVGAFGYNSGTGRAFIYYGGLTPDTTPDVTLTGEASASYFGTAVSATGDVNGDGYADVLVGAYNFQGGQGRAYLFHGGPVVDVAPDLKLTGEASGDYFGISLASAGDVNGDAFADFIVGAIGHNASRGRAYVYYGGSSTDPRPDLTLSGPLASGFFGSSVAAGDVNGDGYSDLLVGGWNAGGTGRAYVYYGGLTADEVPDHTLNGEAASSQFGMTISTAGDVSGDGFNDVVVGATGYGGNQGRAYVYDFNRYFVTSPNGGETWNVGATKAVTWLGSEKADVWVSTDAGKTYDLLGSGLGGDPANAHSLRVPHSPGKFTMVKVTPSDASLGGSDRSDSLFTIQTSVALLALTAAPLPERAGAVLTWNTDPGPDDLAGYRLERSASGEAWRTVVSLTRETTFTDASAGASGARYRLYAVNGFGEELMLGETSLRPMAALSAWPLPYRGGTLNVSFATAGGLGGESAGTEVSIYDVSGRLVRTVARGSYGAGYRTAVWDGRDGGGRTVAAGVYFIRVRSAGEETTLKLAVLR